MLAQATARNKGCLEAGGLAVQSGKPTLLLVSHEASRTGAPILCLSLARHLRDRYNIAILLLRDGPLTPHFRSASVRIAVADAKRDADLSSVIWSLRDPALGWTRQLSTASCRTLC